MRGSYKFITLKVATAYKLLQATVKGHGLSVQTKYVLLKATALVGEFISGLKFNDPTTVVDQQTFSFGKQLPNDDAFTSDSLIGITFAKSLTDTLVITDVFQMGTNTILDTATSTDSGSLIMQSYCDITYFLEDYVGTSRTF